MVKAFLKYLGKFIIEGIMEDILPYTETGKIDDYWDEYIDNYDFNINR
ncbi:unnamed protein product [marine sediment metagenome]|uniref:Uncharacterized protein n=1 Tax=marine sediment metagenome TaxID=412755 RepID=X1UWG6_9ZZZZ